MYSRPPFQNTKKKQKKNASTKTITVIQIRPSSSSSGFQKRFQNHKISAYTHLSSFLPFFLPSFLLPIIQYLRGARRYGRRSIIPDRYIGQLFPRESPLSHPPVGGARTRRRLTRHDATRVAAVAQHKSNENQQRPSCVWIMERWGEFFPLPAHALLFDCDYDERPEGAEASPPLFSLVVFRDVNAKEGFREANET